VPKFRFLIECVNCGRVCRQGDAKEAGWRFYSDGVGELLPFCSLCAYRGPRPAAPASSV
jgi:hypothetical protein